MAACPQHDPGASSAFLWPALAGTVLLGVVLRTHSVGIESAWFDEVLSLRPLASCDTLAAFWNTLRHDDPPAVLAPVYFTLEFAWSRIFGPSVLSIRMLSIALATAALPLCYAIARRLFGAIAGCLAMLCLAMSLVHVFYAQEIRMYALVLVLALLSIHSLLRLIENGGRRWWLLHAGTSLLLVGAHLFAAFLLVAEGLYLVTFHRRPRNRLIAWFAVHAVVAGAAAGWLAYWHAQGVVGTAFWIPPPNLRDAANMLFVFAGGRFSNLDPTPYLAPRVSFDGVLTVFLLAAAGGFVLRVLGENVGPRPNPARRRAVALVLLWLILPPAALYLMSIWFRPCFMYRYVLYASPALYLLAGAGIAAWRSVLLRTVAAALLIALYGYQFLLLDTPFRPDYRAAAHVVDLCKSPRDVVISFKAINTVPFLFAAGELELPHASIHGFRELCDEVVVCHERRENVWVIMWRWDDTRAFETHLAAHGISYVAQELGGMPRLRIYYLLDAGQPRSAWVRHAWMLRHDAAPHA